MAVVWSPKKRDFFSSSINKPKIDQRSKNLECSIRVLVRGIGEFVNGWISGRDSETVYSGQFKSVLNVVLNTN